MQPFLLLFPISVSCSLYQNLLQFAQILRAPRELYELSYQNYLGLSFPNNSIRKIIEARFEEYVEEYCFYVEQFARQLVSFSNGALLAPRLEEGERALDLSVRELLPFFSEGGRSEYARCLGGKLPFGCIQKLIRKQLSGVEATYASLSTQYLEQARQIERQNRIGTFLTHFRPPPITSDYLKELCDFLLQQIEQIEPDRRDFAAEITYAMCMFTFIEYQATFLRNFELAGRALKGTFELQRIFGKLTPTCIHQEKIDSVLLGVERVSLNISTIEVYTVPQRRRLGREYAQVYFTGATMRINLPSYRSEECANVIRNGKEYLQQTKLVPQNPICFPLD